MGNERKDKTIVKSAYIETDYVEHGVVEETDNTPRIEFSFKPLNMIQSSKLTDAVMADKTVAGAALATMEMLTKHIVDWDMLKPDGSKVDFKKVKELEKIDPGVLNRISSRVRRDKSSPEEDVKALREAIKNL
jgi:hypothetical protein